MHLDRLVSQFWGQVRPANYSTNGYPTRVPTVTPPSGAGVLAFGEFGAEASPYLQLQPYGVGADTNTFSLTVLGWRPTNLGAGQPLWLSTPLCSCLCTIASALPGVANADLGVTAYFCKALAVTGGPLLVSAGTAPVSPDWFSITGTVLGGGILSVPSMGFPYLEVVFTTGGSATSCNALWCKG